jgi:hypothetical protein
LEHQPWIIRRALFLLLPVVVGALVAGCGGASSLAGSWSVKVQFTEQPGWADEMFFLFLAEDGTVVRAGSASGTWSVKGDSLTLVNEGSVAHETIALTLQSTGDLVYEGVDSDTRYGYEMRRIAAASSMGGAWNFETVEETARSAGILLFAEDGTFDVWEQDALGGTWRVDGETLTLTFFTDPGEEVTITLRRTSDLVFEGTLGDGTRNRATR